MKEVWWKLDMVKVFSWAQYTIKNCIYGWEWRIACILGSLSCKQSSELQLPRFQRKQEIIKMSLSLKPLSVLLMAEKACWLLLMRRNTQWVFFFFSEIVFEGTGNIKHNLAAALGSQKRILGSWGIPRGGSSDLTWTDWVPCQSLEKPTCQSLYKESLNICTPPWTWCLCITFVFL